MSSFYMIGSNENRLKHLLRGWWHSYRGQRWIADENKVAKLPPCYLYRVTPEMADVIQYTKIKEKDKLRVYEVRELTSDEIRAVLLSSLEAHPSSEAEP